MDYLEPMGERSCVPASRDNALVAVEQSRAIQEVQAALVIAKQFPRDEIAARSNILEACKRQKLAAVAVYSYPRGGALVEGPSIRLAEMLAQYWGNITCGIRELERTQGVSKMEAFAWDQQTNTRITRQFDVNHVRETKQGRYAITDSRDIYEHTANQGARRLRACILSIVPGHIVDEALDQCRKTLAGQGGGEPLEDRAMKLVRAFSEFSVTRDMIEARIGHKIEAISEFEVADLRKIYNALRDGMGDREDYFDITGTLASKTAALKDKLAAKKGPESSREAPEPAPAKRKPRTPKQDPPPAEIVAPEPDKDAEPDPEPKDGPADPVEQIVQLLITRGKVIEDDEVGKDQTRYAISEFLNPTEQRDCLNQLVASPPRFGMYQTAIGRMDKAAVE